MTQKNYAIASLVALLLAALGGGLYQGMARAPQPAGSSAALAPPVALADPSAWGIAEGGAATQRHIDTGLKAGDLDPLTGRSILYYHDPMVPGKKFEAPGKSPFMDMMLVPAYAGAQGGDNGTVSVSARVQQNLGVRTGEVVAGQLLPEVSAVGTVAWNERGQVVVQARATGFIEKLHVRAALDRVAKGQALMEVYVPDWVAAQEDYLSARRLPGRALAPLADAALQRMRQVGMDEEQIALVERSGQVQARMTLRAPAPGVVTELMVREGATVAMGMPLLRINDLSSVWVQAEVPESQSALLAVGAPVVAHTPAWPQRAFRGQVQALLPEVDPGTRTRKARMVLANPRGLLVPGMSMQVQIRGGSPRAQVLLVPSESLLRTGRRTLVMLAEDGGFRPVEVQAGREHAGQTEILAGLRQGQRVVLSGQFLIDSEASLRGVEARMAPAAGGTQ